MGIDIYTFVEVDWGDCPEPFDSADDVRAFNLGEFFVWRSNFALFHALGLGTCPRCRLQRVEGTRGEPTKFPLRGLPAALGQGALDRFFHIVDPHGRGNARIADSYAVRPEQADLWVDAGASHDGPPLEIYRGRGRELLRRVSRPEWHCVSWVDLTGFRDASQHVAEPGPCVHALIAAMDAFESRLGPGRTRLVYWFDDMPWQTSTEPEAASDGEA